MDMVKPSPSYREYIDQIMAEEARKFDEPVSISAPEDVKEIGGCQDLFFAYQDFLYTFSEVSYIQIDSIDLFKEYWQELTEAGALHSVFVNGNVQLEYNNEIPCTIKMSVEYDAAGEIMSRILSGGEVAFSSKTTADLYHKAQDILASIITQDMTDVQKEIAIHDYIVLNSQYTEDGDISYLSKAESVLLDGKGQCQGYSEATALLLTMSGIESRIISGYAKSSNGSQYLHAWNQVRIDGLWYHLDTTWDDPIPDSKGFVSDIYINRSDSFFIRDHYWSSYFIQCPSEYTS
jgi:transglutaminase-like putative cysteine protease